MSFLSSFPQRDEDEGNAITFPPFLITFFNASLTPPPRLKSVELLGGGKVKIIIHAQCGVVEACCTVRIGSIGGTL